MRTKKFSAPLMSLTLLLLTAGSFCAYVAWEHWHHVTVDIGSYATQKDEERAAIQRLSLELTRHPKADSIRIFAGRSAWRNGVMGFARVDRYGDRNIFWENNRFSSASIEPKVGRGFMVEVLVSDAPIHMAAREGGTFSSVSYYNEHMRSETLDGP